MVILAGALAAYFLTRPGYDGGAVNIFFHGAIVGHALYSNAELFFTMRDSSKISFDIVVPLLASNDESMAFPITAHNEFIIYRYDSELSSSSVFSLFMNRTAATTTSTMNSLQWACLPLLQVTETSATNTTNSTLQYHITTSVPTITKIEQGFEVSIKGNNFQMIIQNDQVVNFAGFKVDMFTRDILAGQAYQAVRFDTVPALTPTALSTCSANAAQAIASMTASTSTSSISSSTPFLQATSPYDEDYPEPQKDCVASRTAAVARRAYSNVDFSFRNGWLRSISCSVTKSIFNAYSWFVSSPAICTGNLDYGADKYLVFPGTKSGLDKAADLQFWSTSFPDISGLEVLYGFHSRAMNLDQNQIKGEIKCDNTKWVFIGHSLGGAVASVLAVHYKNKCGSAISIRVVTFGEPAAFSYSSPPAVFSQISFTRYVHSKAIFYSLPCSNFLKNKDVIPSLDPIVILPEVVKYKHAAGSVQVGPTALTSTTFSLLKWSCVTTSSYSKNAPTGTITPVLTQIASEGLVWHRMNGQSGYMQDIDRSDLC